MPTPVNFDPFTGQPINNDYPDYNSPTVRKQEDSHFNQMALDAASLKKRKQNPRPDLKAVLDFISNNNNRMYSNIQAQKFNFPKLPTINIDKQEIINNVKNNKQNKQNNNKPSRQHNNALQNTTKDIINAQAHSALNKPKPRLNPNFLKGDYNKLKNKVINAIPDDIKEMYESAQQNGGIANTIRIGLQGMYNRYKNHQDKESYVKTKRQVISIPLNNTKVTTTNKTNNKANNKKTNAVKINYPSYNLTDTLPDNRGKNYYLLGRSLNLDNFTYGMRRRGEYNNINTEGALITTYDHPDGHKFKNNIDFKGYNGYVGIDKNGKVIVGNVTQSDSITKSHMARGAMIAPAPYNKIYNFKRDKNGNIEYRREVKNGYNVPYIETDKLNGNGHKFVDFNTPVNLKGANKGNVFTNGRGGRVIFKCGDEVRFVEGTTNQIIEEFENMKKRHKAKYVEWYQLDNGTYNRGLNTRNKRFNSNDLKNYDRLNFTGGNFFYKK